MKYKKQEKVPCCQCHLAYYIVSPTSHTSTCCQCHLAYYSVSPTSHTSTCNAVYVNEMIMLDLKKNKIKLHWILLWCEIKLMFMYTDGDHG